MLRFVRSSQLPSPMSLKSELALAPKEEAFIQKTREELRAILQGESHRLAIILGPCSIHDLVSAKEYAKRLKELLTKVSANLLLIMRVYVEKPRTAKGWKGLLHDPLLNGSNEMALGIRLARELLVHLAKEEVPAAMEFLDLMSASYLADLISWGCIGARTAASQPHRQLASALPMPVGFKNATDGDLLVAIAGAQSAASSHSFMHVDETGALVNVHSAGNLDTHIVLRGGSGTNFDPHSVNQALALLKESALDERLIIDCSHGNCGKNEALQKESFFSVISQVVEGNRSIKGAMLESHLQAGSQPHTLYAPIKSTISLTDPCIDWPTTEKLILFAHRELGTPHPLPQQSTPPSSYAVR